MKILKWEYKLVDWIIKNGNWLFILIITCISVIIRISCREFESGDAHFSLLPWFELMKDGGGKA